MQMQNFLQRYRAIPKYSGLGQAITWSYDKAHVFYYYTPYGLVAFQNATQAWFNSVNRNPLIAMTAADAANIQAQMTAADQQFYNQNPVNLTKLSSGSSGSNIQTGSGQTATSTPVTSAPTSTPTNQPVSSPGASPGGGSVSTAQNLPAGYMYSGDVAAGSDSALIDTSNTQGGISSTESASSASGAAPVSRSTSPLALAILAIGAVLVLRHKRS